MPQGIEKLKRLLTQVGCGLSGLAANQQSERIEQESLISMPNPPVKGTQRRCPI